MPMFHDNMWNTWCGHSKDVFVNVDGTYFCKLGNTFPYYGWRNWSLRELSSLPKITRVLKWWDKNGSHPFVSLLTLEFTILHCSLIPVHSQLSGLLILKFRDSVLNRIVIVATRWGLFLGARHLERLQHFKYCLYFLKYLSSILVLSSATYC